MRTAILAGGIAVVRSGVVVSAEDGELAVSFCSLATGLLGQTGLGEKKIMSMNFMPLMQSARVRTASINMLRGVTIANPNLFQQLKRLHIRSGCPR